MKELFETAALVVEAAAVLLLLIGLTLSTGRFLYRTLRVRDRLPTAPFAKSWAAACC